MPAPKGHPRYGGRKKGTPNKSSVPAQQIAERLGVDPFEVLCLFVKGDAKKLKIKKDQLTPGIRVAAAMEAAQYLYPKRKAVEHSGELGLSLTDIVGALGDDDEG